MVENTKENRPKFSNASPIKLTVNELRKTEKYAHISDEDAIILIEEFYLLGNILIKLKNNQ